MVEVKCDVCGNIKEMFYKTYLKVIKDGYYACGKCRNEKIKDTRRELYGDENYNNRAKYKETCNIRFGCDNGFQFSRIKDKIKRSLQLKYNVDNPTQNPDILKKSLKNGNKILEFRDTNIYYQGSYELDFLNNFFDVIRIERGFPIKYIMNGKNKVYHPDFYLPDYNTIVEIKSSYWFEKFKEKIDHQRNEVLKSHNYIIIINKDYSEFKTFVAEMDLISLV